MSGRNPLGMGAPPGKARDFRATSRRLLGYLGREPILVWSVAGLALVAVGLNVIGPKILGHAIDIVFTGFIASRLPAGTTIQRLVGCLGLC